MGANQLLIKKAGIYTSLQDLGRAGLMSKGVARSGVLDRQSALLANWLVGNDPGAAVLETTYHGLSIRFQGACVVAITGGDLGAKLNNVPVELYQPIPVKQGDDLIFSERKAGLRAYLAISGGMDQPEIMGSKSQHSMIDLGIQKVKDDSTLSFFSSGRKQTDKKVPVELKPVFTKHFTARILPGPEYELFPQRYIHELTFQSLKVSSDSNRMGYRLAGDFSDHDLPEGILSSGVIPGTIQVTSSGQPIILMNDGPTTGGYARVSNVLTPDLNHVAQLGPGDTLRFKWVTFDEADRILKNYTEKLNELFEWVL